MGIALKYIWSRTTRWVSHDLSTNPLSRGRRHPDVDRGDFCDRLVASAEPRHYGALCGPCPVGVANSLILALAGSGSPHLGLNLGGNGSYAASESHLDGGLQSIDHPPGDLGHGGALFPPAA